MKNNEQASKVRKYPFRMSRLYVNAATLVLALFMAAVTLTEPLLLLLFLLLTSVISIASFVLKIHPIFRVRKSVDLLGSGAHPAGRRELYIVLIAMIAIILLPFLLFFSARSLPTHIWFVALASVAAGIGISELLFYVYCTRMS